MKWSRRPKKPEPAFSSMPMTIGPETDQVAFKAELKGVIDRMMRQRPTPKGDDLEAAIREVCKKHGVQAGATLETDKLSEPLRSIIWHGAASARVRVGQDDAGAWYVSDHRWLLYIDDDQVAELRAAGAEFVDIAIPAFGRLAGDPEPLDVAPSAMAALHQYGIGGRGNSKTRDGFTNPMVVDIYGTRVAADALAVLAVAGTVEIVIDHEKTMVEGRSSTGRVVGFATGTQPRPVTAELLN